MATADISGITYFLPILSFLLVFVVSYAVIAKSKVIEQLWLQIFVSFALATIFVSAVSARDYVLNIAVWFAVLLISLFLIMLILGLAGKDVAFMHKGIGIAFVVATLIMFVVSAIFVFGDYFTPYLPGGDSNGGNTHVLTFTNWLYSPRVGGAILLLVVSGLVAWVVQSNGGGGKH